MTEPTEVTIIETRHPRFPSAVTLRMNRPQKKNAMRPADSADLGRRLAALQTDPDTRLIFITGTGDAFTAGADINELNTLSGDALASFIEMQVDLLSRIVMSPKIIIAAVNGACSGFGKHVVTCCDLAFIHERSVMHFTGAAKGLPSLLMGTLIMPMTIGLKRAKSLYLRGGKLTARQAVADGLCNYSVGLRSGMRNSTSSPRNFPRAAARPWPTTSFNSTSARSRCWARSSCPGWRARPRCRARTASRWAVFRKERA